MAWLTVDKNGEAWIYEGRPVRDVTMWVLGWAECIKITPESAEKLAGKVMTWDDEPIEV